MGGAIPTPVLWRKRLRLLIANHQRRGIYMLDARNPLGGLPGLIDSVLAG
jgi:hypothetical protein